MAEKHVFMRIVKIIEVLQMEITDEYASVTMTYLRGF